MERYLEKYTPLSLTENFLNKYKNKQPGWGFNGLGYFVYKRTYSRLKTDGGSEEWWETVKRIVEGAYNMQKRWIIGNRLPWSEMKAQLSAQEMYDRMFSMKFLPPGRGIWAMGTAITEERGLLMALNNCAFVSTEDITVDPSRSFRFVMDTSMLGVGMGFDTHGAGQIIIKKPKETVENFVIPDTREGWVESLGKLLDSYFLGKNTVQFDYSLIRPAGSLIRGFGGVSAGYKPLYDLHVNIEATLEKCIGEAISARNIVDIMNMIGQAVVAGNVRRTAELALGDIDDSDYLDLKDYDINPERAAYGWASNNSLHAKVGMNYEKYAQRTEKNGEPGYFWQENAQAYSRMNNGADWRDKRATGTNACAEQTLESYEVCNLVETFPTRHESKEDFLRTLKFAYLYAKTVTLGQTHWPETNRVMLRNRRIGCSVTGIAQFITKHNIEILRDWLETGYDTVQHWDEVYSDWLTVPRSIKTTSIKPSGTVSLLAGATPGVHYPESRYYIRRVRIAKNSPLIEPLLNAGYHIEDAVGDEYTSVISFPVDVGEGIPVLEDVSMWEQLALAAFMQRHWADNQVSCTVSFKPEEGKQIPNALNYYQYQLKAISFLPKTEIGAYAQMPYESIDEITYFEMVKSLKPINFDNESAEDSVGEKFCDSDVCMI